MPHAFHRRDHLVLLPGAGEFAHDPAAEHHHDAVADASSSVSSETSSTAESVRPDDVEQRLLRRDVDAGRRIVRARARAGRKQAPGPSPSSAGFRRKARWCSAPGSLTLICSLAIIDFGEVTPPVGGDEAPPAAQPMQHRQRDVLLDRKIAAEACWRADPPARWATPISRARSTRPACRRPAVDRNPARRSARAVRRSPARARICPIRQGRRGRPARRRERGSRRHARIRPPRRSRRRARPGGRPDSFDAGFRLRSPGGRPVDPPVAPWRKDSPTIAATSSSWSRSPTAASATSRPSRMTATRSQIS